MMLVSSGLRSTWLIPMLQIPFLFAGGDWGLGALIRRAAKRKKPVNPASPVKYEVHLNGVNPV
jgi:hypothetical protein